jgi:TonB family protein
LKTWLGLVLGIASALWAHGSGFAPSRRFAQAPAAQEAKPGPMADDLVEQGKQQYRLANTGNELNRVVRFQRALAKFEAALDVDQNHDAALGLAAETAFRLDDQPRARAWFVRRAELPEQKDTVKAYCYYRAALTLWREAHDLVAKSSGIKEGKIVFSLPEEEAAEAAKHIASGLDYLKRTFALVPNYAEAHNLNNLLHSEAAFLAPDEAAAAEARQQALASLRKAIELYRPRGNADEDAATFGAPTVHISEFAWTKEEEAALDRPMMKLIEGGRPLTRVAAVFPSVRPPKAQTDPKDPSTTGVTPQGGAYSLGAGRGALTAAYLPGIVKVEVLISTTGKVVFAHVVEGRSDLDGAALLAAKRWTFAPAKFEGRPVQVSGVITFDMKPPGWKSSSAPAPAPARKPG